ncbi:host specificity protein J [Xanthomonas translucens]|uniref:host specificity protein J n=2 Tax=Xanthomonas campestris pv. translucens TaxID=343 RepID=UPI00071BAB7C|nr:host specificity protein J [Xanthomonas translucens]MCT8281739.1 host specificity protein J [Xanthomonas translucens pv. undulosa]MCT8316507.1 host specificity protein J [Xanthomonas translucens pv. undulosa]UKE38258.1 host specificity protein J [Xanthomonas translucens pv. undulosa]
MSAAVDIRGAKKGQSSARAPVETPDSLQSIAYAKILLAIGEGEIKGPVNGLQSVYLDGTRLQNPDGTFNFQNVRAEWRVGTQDQDYIAGFPSVENEIAVGVELTDTTPVVRTLSGSDLSSVRIRMGTPSLQKTDTSTGDITGYSITYAVDIATDGGAYSTVLTDTITGKTTTLYERSRTVDLPAGSQWQVRIRRLTPNANSSTIADVLYVQALTEIIDAKLRYPNTALLALELNASQFQAIPTIGVWADWMIVKVPSNYDPATRSYSGIWDGTFKSAWTDNPAWVFFDICTNDRYGLGHRIPAAWVDRWRLYQIAQYCDQLVSDGLGGQEPRFTCNPYFQTQADAWKVLSDLAAVFRGITYYAAGQVMASADMPVDLTSCYTFSAANVVDGRFTYEGSGRKTRHTVALVSWNDPSDFGRAKAEPVEYRPGIARYGIQQTSVTALGCSSRAQAQRIGLHILLSENLETETIGFGTGLEGHVPQPGEVIAVQDPARAGRRNSGRIRSATSNSVTVDKVPPTLEIGDSIRILLRSGGRSEARTVSAINGSVISVGAPWTTIPIAQSVFAVEQSDLALQYFKVISVKHNDDGMTFQVTGLKHVNAKYAAIDDGARIELSPISIIPPSVQPPPSNVALSSHSVIDQGIATHVLTISWDAAPKAIAYDVEWRRDDMAWVKAGRATTTNMEVRGIYAGQYLARVRAVNALNAVSMPALSALTTIEGKTTPPPALTTLTASGIIFGIELAWTFPPGATDTQRTEIWYGPANVLANAIKLGDFAYPQAKHTMMGLAAGVQFFFWGRLVDRSGNIGPWYPLVNGVVGRSSTDANAILDYLTGKITASQLGKDLLSKVDSISDLLPLVWNSGATYSQGQTVIYEGQIYSWESSTAGNETPPGANWKDVGDALAQVGAVVGQVNSNTQAISVLDGKVKAQGTKVDGIFAQLDVKAAGDTDWGAGDTNVYAGTITVQSVIASGDLAQAKRTDTVEANLGTTNAAVQVTSQAVAALDGKASSSYIVKTAVTSGGQYYAAGIALGIDASGGTVQSSFLVHADMFGVLNSTGSDATVISPFVIQNGQTFINQAFIGDAWINSAKIADGAITNAKIGEYIQSFNYSEGKSGWRLSKDGNLDINGVGGGFRLRINNSGVYLFYDDGSPAVELGVLS